MPRNRPFLPFVALAAGLTATACSKASAAPQEHPDQEKLERWTAEIQGEVEALRGERFPKPVGVAVSTAEEFRAYVLARLERLETPERIQADEDVAKLLGLLTPEFDYMGKMLDLIESQVGGFYDPGEKRFFLMEGFGGDLARIILAHELTHALDDQLYGLDQAFEARKDNTDALWAFNAVSEGSGTDVMNRWTLQHVTDLDREALLESSTMGMDELAEAPTYLWKPLIGAYMQGASFLGDAPKELSPAEVTRRAFQNPPLSSEQVLHPEKYWDPAERDDPVPIAVEPGELPAGWVIQDEDTLGEMGLALVVEPLERRGGVDNALAMATARMTWKAAKGWGGDRYVLLGRGEDRLLYLATAWDREKDAREFESAMADLREHLESGFADGFALSREGDRVHVVLAKGAEPELIASAPSWARFLR